MSSENEQSESILARLTKAISKLQNEVKLKKYKKNEIFLLFLFFL